MAQRHTVYLKRSAADVTAELLPRVDPGRALAPIRASRTCLWLAQQLGGIVRDPRGDWYEPTDGLDFKPL